MFIGVKWKDIKAGSMDKAPVLKPNVQTRTMPCRAIRILVTSQAPSYFTLITKGHQFVCKARLNQAMKEGGDHSRFNSVRAISRDGDRVLFRVVEGDAEPSACLTNSGPEGGIGVIQSFCALVGAGGEVGGNQLWRRMILRRAR